MKDKPAVVTAWAEPCAGPGWANKPVWVLLRDKNNVLSIRCIQPEDQPDAMRVLYGVSAEVHKWMAALAVKEGIGE